MARQLDILPVLSGLPFSKGAIAGAIATIPMTAFMLAAHRLLPGEQRYALPPEQVTKEAADRAQVSDQMDKQQLIGATLLSHFGYGASMGSLYATLMRKLPMSPLSKGVLFGLGIWAASYLGWMPIKGFSAAATDEPPQRNFLMIASHVIWGAATGIVDDFLED